MQVTEGKRDHYFAAVTFRYGHPHFNDIDGLHWCYSALWSCARQLSVNKKWVTLQWRSMCALWPLNFQPYVKKWWGCLSSTGDLPVKALASCADSCTLHVYVFHNIRYLSLCRLYECHTMPECACGNKCKNGRYEGQHIVGFHNVLRSSRCDQSSFHW